MVRVIRTGRDSHNILVLPRAQGVAGKRSNSDHIRVGLRLSVIVLFHVVNRVEAVGAVTLTRGFGTIQTSSSG